MTRILHQELLGGTVHAYTSPDVEGLFVTGATRGDAYAETVRSLRARGVDGPVVDGDAPGPGVPIVLSGRWIGDQYLISSPDVKGLYVADKDPSAAWARVAPLAALMAEVRERKALSGFEEFLDSEGMLEDVTATALRRVDAWRSGRDAEAGGD